jgi:hypothetical protein
MGEKYARYVLVAIESGHDAGVDSRTAPVDALPRVRGSTCTRFFLLPAIALLSSKIVQFRQDS